MPSTDSILVYIVMHWHPLWVTFISLGLTAIFTSCGGLFVMKYRIPDHFMGYFYALTSGAVLANAVGLMNESHFRSLEVPWAHAVPWVPTFVGSIMGVIMMLILYKICDFLHKKTPASQLNHDPSEGNEMLGPLVTSNDENSDEDNDGKRALLSKTQHAAAETAVLDAYANKSTANGALLVALALMLQQIPEGITTGIAFTNAWHTSMANPSAVQKAMRIASSVTLNTWATSTVEGISITTALIDSGVSKTNALGYLVIASMLETVAGIFGCLLTSYISEILPFLLAFVSAASIYIFCKELLPISLSKRSNETLVIILLMTSFSIMTMIINLFP